MSGREIPLACPACFDGSLEGEAPLRCGRCGTGYPVEDGIPILLPPSTPNGDRHKAKQAAFFDDGTDEEFEIERPHGTPAFHEWMLMDKFRRSVSAVSATLAGTRVVTVCGGSGMDAEFLARAGAKVVTADISLGAARRARERARRHGLEITSIVADAERLPLRDRSVELAYVHDGLHHLEHPRAGLAEMARVAARAVSVTEPADAAATRLAVRVGLALAAEEAGNPVARLSLEEVAGELRSHGFAVVEAERYAMLYRHLAGHPSRLLSSRVLLPAARAGLAVFNRVAGGIGNKLTVQAIRPRKSDALNPRKSESLTRRTFSEEGTPAEHA